MLMVQQCAGQRGQRPAQAEIALGNKGLKFGSRKIVLKRMLARRTACNLVSGQFDDEQFNSDII